MTYACIFKKDVRQQLMRMYRGDVNTRYAMAARTSKKAGSRSSGTNENTCTPASASVAKNRNQHLPGADSTRSREAASRTSTEADYLHVNEAAFRNEGDEEAARTGGQRRNNKHSSSRQRTSPAAGGAFSGPTKDGAASQSHDGDRSFDFEKFAGKSDTRAD
ncbi:unnamed protein product, partial [Amoebophrya sp. A25]|eukprot:GSA25T00006450001.1